MMRRIWNKIFGVPQGSIEAARILGNPSPAMFKAASKLTAEEIDGAVADDGSCWERWRVDHATGEQWFRRISKAPTSEPSFPVNGGQSDTSDEFFYQSDDESEATTTDDDDSLIGDEADDIFCDNLGHEFSTDDDFEDSQYDAR